MYIGSHQQGGSSTLCTAATVTQTIPISISLSELNYCNCGWVRFSLKN